MSRVIHLTFHKCGSQWVRDVLTAPEVVAHSGVRLDGRSPNLLNDDWPAQERGTFLGPLYNAAPADWHSARQPDDRAFVVLRDPRDRLISWMFSVTYSHVMDPNIRTLRGPLQALDARHRIQIGIFEFSRIARMFRLWREHGTAHGAFLTTYEAIVENQTAEFRRMLDFLGWKIPASALDIAVGRLSFETRSGRQRGDENIQSHYRKGKAGDWRNHFDRDLGEIWEGRFPGLLAALGYEQDPRWFEALPEQALAAAQP